MITNNLPQRRIYTMLCFISLLLLAGCAATPAPSTAVAQPRATPEAPVTNADGAWQRLLAGNQRYQTARFEHPHQSVARRAETAAGQKPFALVLSCADSRVTPELVFDQGIGDLFVVRVAGNVLDNTTLGSLEFAVAEFGAPLLVVLGHERCGAVKATIEAVEHKAPQPAAPGEIPSIVKALTPAVMQIKNNPGDLLDNSVRSNIALVVAQLRQARPVLASAQQSGKLKIVGARYDLDSGAVEITVP